MTYFTNSTDSSDQYRPTAAAGASWRVSTAAPGNLAHMMKNATVYQTTFISPEVVRSVEPISRSYVVDIPSLP